MHWTLYRPTVVKINRNTLPDPRRNGRKRSGAQKCQHRHRNGRSQAAMKLCNYISGYGHVQSMDPWEPGKLNSLLCPCNSLFAYLSAERQHMGFVVLRSAVSFTARSTVTPRTGLHGHAEKLYDSIWVTTNCQNLAVKKQSRVQYCVCRADSLI